MQQLKHIIFQNLLNEPRNLKTIIFQCSKNYGRPTRVTRLKVTANMTDPISLNEKRPNTIMTVEDLVACSYTYPEHQMVAGLVYFSWKPSIRLYDCLVVFIALRMRISFNEL